ncbi:hypothetical protein PTTG_07680 [Puccinia triticina 1-1 BBBD Race 1]|uniref:FUN14 domain-containing protein n=2 Tax=Puccinia triticina TaxID=208348 RepID=A0A180GW28_PUCT1|nr:uncharacterized protein PtA15_18A252 [Puccinia triticina]OAV96731.1 hypothetical protein PTTG_07680 [Puccinia triticina 1-1 BBBD Race 1]WAQ93194.1 hypothetical protein PtA15_18A252 [Puccinia triticina]WAR63167.1 hypothetical protein PtB15_18B249 [Puccinia triticina]
MSITSITPQMWRLRHQIINRTPTVLTSSITNSLRLSKIGRPAVLCPDSNTNRFLQWNHNFDILKGHPRLQSGRPVSIPRQSQSFKTSGMKYTSSLGILLAIAGYQLTKPAIQLESELSPGPMIEYHQQQPTEPEIESLLSVRKLSFGTLTGICAGVFVKKGLNFLAFIFGGGFVLLQYLHSSSLIKIDWKTWAHRYESRFWSNKDNSRLGGPPAKPILARFLHFLTSDFQYRSTFTVGFFLGLRIG